MITAGFYHLFNLVVHGVFQPSFRDYFILKLPGPVFQILYWILSLRFVAWSLLPQVENYELCLGDILLLEIWAYDYSKEREAVLVEVHLLRMVGNKVLDRGVHIENRVAVVPG
jgi:hypothetical protein